MKKLTAAELRKIMASLVIATAKHKESAKVLENHECHPQLREVYHRVNGMSDAFQAVLEALQGDPVLLNIYKE